MPSPEILSQRGLFQYDEAAVAEINEGFVSLDLAATESERELADPERLELLYLNAAEYSLARLLPYAGPVLPLGAPIQVEHGDAVCAVLKTNCHPIFCFANAERRVTDVTAFGSDASKLESMGMTELPDPEAAVGEFAAAAANLERYHQESPVRRGQVLGESGVLRLQAFLWAVKACLPRRELENTVNEAYESLDLALPSGGALARVN